MALSTYPPNVTRRDLEVIFARKPWKTECMIGEFDDNGKRNSVFYTYTMGLSGPHLTRRKEYKHGKIDGLSEAWYSNGQLQASINYCRHMRHGSCETWFADGHPQFSASYIMGQQDGVHQCWRENKSQIYKISFDNGAYHGPYERWYANGNREASGSYKDGVLHGISEGWYENDVQHYLETYKNGEKDGLQLRWYDNGLPLTKAMYRDGKRHGVSLFWDENGVLEDVHLYENDNLQKSYTEELFDIQKEDMVKAQYGIKRRDAMTLAHDQIVEITRRQPELQDAVAVMGYTLS